ncbi:MAG: SOS response-associated peptidase [Longimicrobiales bacterium]
MCGRYSLAVSPEALRETFGVDDIAPDVTPRYTIAPQTPVLAIGRSVEGHLRAGMLRWGLVPWWAKDPSAGQRMINARAESLTQKPAFREAFERRRCLIAADGFYEWRREGGRKVPMRIRLPDAGPFGFAGIWERWRNPEGERLFSCAIVTVDANDALRPIHNRMPVILDAADRDAWLDPTRSTDELLGLLRPYAGKLEVYEVSPLVNAAVNDDPACFEPVRREEQGVIS